MPSQNVNVCTRIVRRSVFFNEDFGTIWRGNVIPGIAPIAAVLDATQDLESAISSSNPQIKKELLSRTFVLYNTTPEHLKQRLAVLAKKTPFITRLICSTNDGRVLSRASIADALILRADSLLPQDTLLILYADGISEHSLQTQKHMLSRPEVKQKVIDLMASCTRNVSFVRRITSQENNILCVARYNPAAKPWLHRVLDSVFYMEKRELLTKQELILRYVFTVLLFPTIIVPLACLVMAFGRDHRIKLAASGLSRWQYLQHKKQLTALSSVPALLKDTSIHAERYKEMLFQLLIEKGYLDATKAPTPLGRKTSDRHNLMLATPSSALTNKQLAARCLLWSCTALSLVSATAYFVLIAAPFVNKSRAFTAFTIAAMSALLATGVLAFHMRNKTVQYAIISGLAFSTIALATISAIFSLSGQLPMAQHKISSLTAFIVICAAAVTCMAISENFIFHKNDRTAAKLLGLSLTAYLNAKPDVKAELRKCNEEYLMVAACLDALQTGGADIGPLLDHPSTEPFAGMSATLSSRTA